MIHALAEVAPLHRAIALPADVGRAALAAVVQEVLVAQDAAAARDRYRRVEIIAGDHAHVNPRLEALVDRGRNLGAQRVLDAHDAEEGEFCLHRQCCGAVGALRTPTWVAAKSASAGRSRYARPIVRIAWLAKG